jgi:hypothetical protein
MGVGEDASYYIKKLENKASQMEHTKKKNILKILQLTKTCVGQF